MLTLEQAQAAILAAVRRGSRTETVPLARAPGRYVAAGLRARIDYPGFDNSAMDGYALRTADLATQDSHLPLAGEARCGDAPGQLAPGTARRIFTGAPLPAGADTVAVQEDVRVENGVAAFPRNLTPEQNIRRRGGDFREGDRLYPPGHRLTAWDLGLLSAAGLAEIEVYARPRVLVVATGDELVAPGAALKPGQIYDSNRLVTLCLLAQLGADVTDGGAVRDEPGPLRALLTRSGDFDFIVTGGGASVGDYDLVKQAFAEIGEIKFWKVGIKPGKPIAFGHVGERTNFFALPGNPMSNLVTFKLFVEPAVVAWHHARAPALTLPAQAANGFRRRPGRTEFLRARLYSQDGRLMVDVFKGQESHMLGPLRETNVLVRVEADSSGFETGDTVSVLPLRLDGA